MSRGTVQIVSAYYHFTDASQIRSQLLASKSNYECIVDRTHSQLGLSYPDDILATVITKRNSHSTAERGRRDRMRTALQELAKLLPRDVCVRGFNSMESTTMADKEGTNSSSGDGSIGGSQTNSTISTVDKASEYIKSLQRKILEMEAKLEQKQP